jgi:hypothetical protein
MVEIPLWKSVLIIYVKYFFVMLALPSVDGQQWMKHVKTLFYIKLVALDGFATLFICDGSGYLL